jgi:hypothetical protein
MGRLLLSALLAATFGVACGLGAEGEGEGEGEGEQPLAATFTNVKREIFIPNCSARACHDDNNPVRNLVLDGDTAVEDLIDVDATIAGEEYVLPGRAESSLLFKILSEPPDDETSAEKVDLLKAWIDDGAADD